MAYAGIMPFTGIFQQLSGSRLPSQEQGIFAVILFSAWITTQAVLENAIAAKEKEKSAAEHAGDDTTAEMGAKLSTLVCRSQPPPR